MIGGRRTRILIMQCIILAVGLVFGVGLIITEQEQIKADLIRFNQSLALSINPEEIAGLSGSQADLNSVQYKKIKNILYQAKQIQADARFVYIFGQRPSGEIFFYADNEPESSGDYSPPGQVYAEAMPEDKQIFIDGKPVAFVNSDSWGNWITVEVPIFDAAGKVVATLNTDMPQSIYYLRMFYAGAVPIGISLVFILILYIIRKISENQEKMLLQRSEYFSVAAHDLKAPLVGMRWLIETIIKTASAESVSLKTNLEKVLATSKEMLGSIDDLLNASKSQLGRIVSKKSERINLLGMTRRILSNLALLIEQNKLQVNVKLPGTLQIMGDAEAIRRALGNLISNAIKYSSSGGVIDIIGKVENGRSIWVIKDRGIGIPRDEIDKVITGYYRASNAKNKGIPGTGLGLYYTNKVVDAHKGHLRLESEENKGLVATIDLPAYIPNN